MNPRVKVLMMLLILMILPLTAAMATIQHLNPIDPGSGGGTCSSSCAVQCANGYWSSIGCLSGQCAHCPCNGGIPQPYCT